MDLGLNLAIPGMPTYVPNFEAQMEELEYAPFKRGVMRFDDYNYNMYNKYILIDSQKATKLGYGSIKGGSAVDTGPRLT